MDNKVVSQRDIKDMHGKPHTLTQAVKVQRREQSADRHSLINDIGNGYLTKKGNRESG